MSKKFTYKVKSDEEFFVLAIGTTEDDYRLAWLLNECLRIDLTRTEHVDCPPTPHFPSFFFTDELRGISYTMVANRTKEGCLLPQLKNVDYILKISGTLADNTQTALLSKIRSIREITACIAIEPNISSILSFLKEL